MIALGFDPGLATTGYGLVEKKSSRYYHVAHGVIRTGSTKSLPERLAIIYEGAQELIKTYKPNIVAVERIYFEKNVTNGIFVAQARGVLLLACAHEHVSVTEFSPTEIKIALVGYGRAEKHQVQCMIQRLLLLDEIPKPDDAGDALAIALCALHVQPLPEAFH
ncbi:MAG TPA: crossover junction endodeoxyribonuclease RuvC [Candidatus Hydrogenedens sp.]|nr:crossover junction endodeoxyribonuclease RuvC [Candidatus Hydrogenedens sp.]HOL18866.1 crossover junction endodeoxyribonuclease RuvC [Candidatus Hydrogenedens sp.]HPP59764.1 crossover junction endodeoxyribonuclease RuvC [Candidatus Hydrogenedens sp.]